MSLNQNRMYPCLSAAAACDIQRTSECGPQNLKALHNLRLHQETSGMRNSILCFRNFFKGSRAHSPRMVERNAALGQCHWPGMGERDPRRRQPHPHLLRCFWGQHQSPPAPALSPQSAREERQTRPALRRLTYPHWPNHPQGQNYEWQLKPPREGASILTIKTLSQYVTAQH